MDQFGQSFAWLYNLGRLSIDLLDNWPHALAALCDEVRGRAPETPIVLKFRNGIQLEMMPGGAGGLTILFPEIFGRQVYEPREFSFPRNPTIVDLGANVGFFACKLANRFPEGRVIAVEAMPEYVNLLRKNATQSGLSNVQIMPCAVGRSAEPVEIEYWFTPSGYLKVSAPPPSVASQRVRIDAAPLATVFESQGVAECDLLKVDIEGHEYDVLCSAPDTVLRSCRQIAMEWHYVPSEPGQPTRFAELQETLVRCGFEILPRSDLRYESGRTGMLYAIRL